MIRFVLSLMLALTLALTSQSMAVARGASAATGTIVLCTGSGPMTVHVDAQGNPTSAPQICPDAALNIVLADVMRAPIAPQHLLRFRPVARSTTMATPRLPHLAPPARAPPLMISNT